MAGPLHIALLGATGTIGRAVAAALVADGHTVVCLLRPTPDLAPDARPVPPDCAARYVHFADAGDVLTNGFAAPRFDAVVSCLASRTGTPRDAWAVDHQAHLHVLAAAEATGVGHLVLLSAICLQKPRLAFQHAKLAFEQRLRASSLRWSIVRPTAYFKSLSGQIERVRKGRPFLLFGDGRGTACKPISDRDLARYLADCLHQPERWNQVLPIGGPGPAITPREQGERLFDVFGQRPRFRHVPVRLLDGIIAVLSLLGRLWPTLADKAELARIGRYYATESMLVLNPATGQYDAAATPETGHDTLFAFYAQQAAGDARPARGDHAVF